MSTNLRFMTIGLLFAAPFASKYDDLPSLKWEEIDEKDAALHFVNEDDAKWKSLNFVKAGKIEERIDIAFSKEILVQKLEPLDGICKTRFYFDNINPDFALYSEGKEEKEDLEAAVNHLVIQHDHEIPKYLVMKSEKRLSSDEIKWSINRAFTETRCEGSSKAKTYSGNTRLRSMANDHSIEDEKSSKMKIISNGMANLHINALDGEHSTSDLKSQLLNPERDPSANDFESLRVAAEHEWSETFNKLMEDPRVDFGRLWKYADRTQHSQLNHYLGVMPL